MLLLTERDEYFPVYPLILALVILIATLVTLGLMFNLALRCQRQQRLAAELTRNQGRLNESQQLAKIGTWELDLQRKQLWWSDEIYRMFEMEPGQSGGSCTAWRPL